MPPNWDEINRCSIWKVLGVTECNNCDSCIQCWGEETVLPEGDGEASVMVIEGLPHHDPIPDLNWWTGNSLNKGEQP